MYIWELPSWPEFKFITLLLIFSFAVSSQAFANCAQFDEAEALDLRALKSSMMVAALSCNQQDQYNQFITKYKDDFSKGSAKIKSYFKRIYGTNYKKQLNHFITSLANKATKYSMEENTNTYCLEMSLIFEELNNPGTHALERFLEKEYVASLHGVDSCS